jgi:hypothetical protein
MGIWSVVAASSVLAVFLVWSWLRELRHRRALQSILRKVFEKKGGRDEPSYQPIGADRTTGW